MGKLWVSRRCNNKTQRPMSGIGAYYVIRLQGGMVITILSLPDPLTPEKRHGDAWNLGIALPERRPGSIRCSHHDIGHLVELANDDDHDSDGIER